MSNKTDQPIPEEQQTTTPEGEENLGKETEKPTSTLGMFIDKVKEMMGESKKVKLVVVLFGFLVVVFFLAVVLSIIRRPPRVEVPKVEPTPQPVIPTPTPAPEETREEIDELTIEIDEFDPSQKDLQPPVVDLEISL